MLVTSSLLPKYLILTILTCPPRLTGKATTSEKSLPYWTIIGGQP